MNNMITFEMSKECELLETLRNDPKIVVFEDYKNSIEDEWKLFLSNIEFIEFLE